TLCWGYNAMDIDTLKQLVDEYLNLSPEMTEKLFLSIIIFLLLSGGKLLINIIIKKRVEDATGSYRWRRAVLYTYTILLIVLIGPIWIRGITSLTTFLGLASAGIAVAMHDTIANLAGWFFIIWRKPFKVGDRIEIGEIAGDVIDIRIFQFSIIEIGNWVDADQSTGRIVHVPNSKVLREPLANSHIGFEYIWHEIPVLITFESDWKKAKDLLIKISSEDIERLSTGAQDQIRHAAKKYLIFYGALTPIVYTTVKDSGVLLTIRYLVDPRQRRSTEQKIWEAVLDAFAKEKDIDLAYPTTRFYRWEKGPMAKSQTDDIE
ncbi:mechanosensitive ion channel family protein, partial [Thermodesulfobacteriota bacterium]